jgi:hypothetical protein
MWWLRLFGPFSIVVFALHLKSPESAYLLDMEKPPEIADFRWFLVEVTGFEPAAFWSRNPTGVPIMSNDVRLSQDGKALRSAWSDMPGQNPL